MVAPKQMRTAQRCDILCVLVIESTQHMQNLFPELYDSVITKIITQLRTPTLVETAAKKGQATKASPCVRLGVVFFGDYYPYSTQTCSTQYFTSNYREFTKTIKAHKFCEGGQLRCAATDGLVSALEMFDDFAEFDPEAHLANVQQRHAILVSSTPPYADPCRENIHMRYDGFGLDDVAKRMRELKLSFSLIQERGKKIEQVEGLLKTANVSSKPPLELPQAMSPNFDVRLMGIDLPIPPEFSEPTAQTIPIAPAVPANAAQQQPAVQPHISIQPLPNPSTQPLPQPQIQSQTQPQPPVQANAQQHQQQQQQSAAPIAPVAPAVPATPVAQTIPQKNKADVISQPSESPALAKKQKLDTDIPTTAGVAAVSSPNADEQPKTVRGKGRQKSAGGGRKAARASNSPAVSAKPNPAASQAAVSSAAGAAQQQQQHQQALVSSGAAVPAKSPAGPQPQHQVQQQAQHQPQPQQAGTIQMDVRPEALSQAFHQLAASPYAAILSELRNRGASAEDLRLFVILATQFQNPNRQQHERIDLKRQMDVLIARLRQNTGVADTNAASGAPQGAQSTDNAATAATPTSTNTAQNAMQQQAQQQQQQQQNMLSSTNQTSIPPTNITQGLLQHTMNLVHARLNIDIRQVLTMLTPDAFEAQVREVCRDQPEVLANIQSIKTTFAYVKNFQAAQAAQVAQQTPRQAQSQPQPQPRSTPIVANAQLVSPAGSQAASATAAVGANGTQAINAGGAAGNQMPQASAQLPNQLWQGVLAWDSKQGDNKNHEPSCLIAATEYPGIAYSQQELRLAEWPDHIKVNATIPASEQFAEQCIRTGIQMVQISAHPSASAESTKYFEDFCATIREMSLYVLIGFNQQPGALTFPGIFITYFRGNLVALPFVNRQISPHLTRILTQHSAEFRASLAGSGSGSTAAAQASAAVATPASFSAVQMTPQQQPSTLPLSAATNASNLTRSGSLGNQVSTPANSAAPAQQMMSPMQQFAARPLVASPAMSNAVPNQQMQLIYGILQKNLSADTMEALNKHPPQKRDVLAIQLFNRIRTSQQLQQQQSQAQAQAQAQVQPQQPQPQPQQQQQSQPQAQQLQQIQQQL
ncbi:hypothetical protein LPJ56_002252, partial [Coemansia sp. RSA 2599]